MSKFERAFVPRHAGYIASRCYALGVYWASSAAVAAIDTIYFYPFVLPAPISFTSGSMRVATGGAGSAVKAGIWANSPVSNRPLGAPLYTDNTGVATTGAGVVAIALGSGSLEAGVMYWWGSKFTGTLPSMNSLASQETTTAFFAGLASSAGIGAAAYAYADTYANSMPTIAEGGSFTNPATGAPVGFLNT